MIIEVERGKKEWRDELYEWKVARASEVKCTVLSLKGGQVRKADLWVSDRRSAYSDELHLQSYIMNKLIDLRSMAVECTLNGLEGNKWS
jgi:hypothetical protein